MGIEDAIVLAACLAHHSEPDQALHAYQAARLPRARMVVRDSARLGKVFASASPVFGRVRNAALLHLPARINNRIVARYASNAAFERTLTKAAAPHPR